METIAYGGAFDPPQLAHQSIVGRLAERLAPKRIIIVPSGPNDYKTYRVAESHRQKMIDIFFGNIRQEIPHVELCDDFLLGNIPDTTTLAIDTILRSRLGYSPTQVFGTDVIPHMGSWDPSGRVERELPKIFVSRKGFSPDMGNVGNYTLFDPDFPDAIAELSSTAVREGIRERVFRGLDPNIERYIRQHNLYR